MEVYHILLQFISSIFNCTWCFKIKHSQQIVFCLFVLFPFLLRCASTACIIWNVSIEKTLTLLTVGHIVFVSTYVCSCNKLWACTYTCLHVYNDKIERRDAPKLFVPSDEAESSSDRFHLPCVNLNLLGCGTSNSPRTNGICQPTLKCLFIYLVLSALTKGFKCASTHAAGDFLSTHILHVCFVQV